MGLMQSDDGFPSGPVAAQFVHAAARGGDPDIPGMALVRVVASATRWYGALTKPLERWNRESGPCHESEHRSDVLRHAVRRTRRCGSEPRSCATSGRWPTTLPPKSAGPWPPRRSTRDRRGGEELVGRFLDRGADAVEAGVEPWAIPRAGAEKQGQARSGAMLEACGRS